VSFGVARDYSPHTGTRGLESLRPTKELRKSWLQAFVEGLRLPLDQRQLWTLLSRFFTMSHEGSAQFPSGSSPPPQQFSNTASGFNKNNVPLTTLEQWAIGRSDTSFRAAAGAAAGIMSGIVTCPLDVIKTKLQAQGGFRNQTSSPRNVVYRGLIGTGRVIWREEGLRGMYRGLGPIILGYLPTWAVWFTIYGRSKEYFEKSTGML
jgi:solute carrier family 25 folate transporter 32